MDQSSQYSFLKKRHIAFLRRCLSILPAMSVTYDTSRMTVLFFALSGLDILGALEDIPQQEIEEIIEWIYSLQLIESEGHSCGGFRGGHCITNITKNTDCSSTASQQNVATKSDDGTSPSSSRLAADEQDAHSTQTSASNGHLQQHQVGLDVRLQSTKPDTPISKLFNGGSDLAAAQGSASALDTGHITMTYTALMALLMLGDDLARVDRTAVLRHVAALQCPDGSFLSNAGGSENDLRFVYCAAAVCHVLGGTSSIDTAAAVQYIKGCLGYGGALGQSALQESHGGSTYCGVAALRLLGALPPGEDGALGPRARRALLRWLLLRQEEQVAPADIGVNVIGGGFQGRPNKPGDSCYTFWIGAALKILGCSDLLDGERLLQFVLSTQDPVTGGLAKHSGSPPDGLHTYLGLSGLATLGLQPDLREVQPALNITLRAVDHLDRLRDRGLLPRPDVCCCALIS